MDADKRGQTASPGMWQRPPTRQVIAPPVVVVAEKLCICERPNTVIICRRCGYIHSNARVACICPVHPRTSYLSDMKQCPKCHTQYLVEME